jgi:hypothetical protein
MESFDNSQYESAEIFDFPQIVLQKDMPFRRIIRKKSRLSPDFSVEKLALMQNNLQITSLSADHPAERHAFPWYTPKNYTPESSIFPWIIRGKTNFMHEYLCEFAKK